MGDRGSFTGPTSVFEGRNDRIEWNRLFLVLNKTNTAAQCSHNIIYSLSRWGMPSDRCWNVWP